MLWLSGSERVWPIYTKSFYHHNYHEFAHPWVLGVVDVVRLSTEVVSENVNKTGVGSILILIF